MKIRYYLITAILALALFLIINIPAASVVSALKTQLPQINMQNVSGTLWQGSAQQVTVPGHVFRNVNWSVCAAHLLIARACIEFDALYNNSPLSGQLSVGMSQTLHGKDIRAEMNARTLGQLAALPMGEIAGDVALELASLSWQPGGVPALNGIIKWSNASVTIAEMARLGDITITLAESDENPINASVSNQNGQLAIAGQASLGANTDYQVDLNLSLQNGASNNLKSSLSLFAKPQPNGQYLLKNSGNLKQLGLM